MDFGEELVRWSIRASGLLFALVSTMSPGWLGLTAAPPGPWLRSRSAIAPHLIWSAACSLLVVHEAAALGVYFQWRQAAAWEHIAQQTYEFAGIRWGGGLVINYITAALWSADVVWSWFAPASYFRRPRYVGRSLWVLLAVVFFFGGVGFEEGLTRWIAVALFLAIGVAIVARRFHRRFHRRQRPNDAEAP